MKVSLILTVLNEVENIKVFLDSIEKQSRMPDEVVICDAGSTDGTLEILQAFKSNSPIPIKVIQEPGNRSKGRNVAICHSRYEIIAGTDAGCILDQFWLKNLISQYEKDPHVDVIAGFFIVRGETLFEKCSAIATLSTKGVKPETFLPSCRSIAFKRTAWIDVGGFPENLDFAEDTMFDIMLKNAGKRFAFAEDALVYWRPRGSCKQVFRQCRNYAHGNAIASIFLKKYVRIHIRYFLWLALSIGLFVNIWVSILWVPFFLMYWLKWSFSGWHETRNLRALAITPFIKFIADAGDIVGFWRGLFGMERG